MRSIHTLPVILALCIHGISSAAETKTAPLKIMLITGGCCHDYKTQTEILKKGIEQRVNAEVTQVHVDDSSTKPALPIYGNAAYAEGFDLVIHDECAAGIADAETVKGVLKPHADGLPGVNLHCAMHSYRSGKFQQKVETTADNGKWFEYLGLQSSGHGPQKPIDITYIDKNHQITKNLADWTTIKEELYNNIAVHEGAVILARGKQEKQETVVAWTNLYGPKKTRVFSTTIGHNNETVADARYLDLVANGVLWACDKLDSTGKPAAGYGGSAK
jgi:type 1 glutamine amidotransferase